MRCRDLENTNLVHQCLLRGGGGGEGDGAELDDPKLSSHRVDYWDTRLPDIQKKVFHNAIRILQRLSKYFSGELHVYLALRLHKNIVKKT